ncbi:MAG: CbiQ family ECF transporter T component [Candidatus Hodarchaeota archaeon]
MSFMLRRIYQGFSYHPDVFHVHPLIGLTILGLQFLFLVIGNNFQILIPLLSLILVENILYGNFRGIISLLRAMIPLLLLLGGLTFFFGGWQLAILIIFRLLAGALSCSFFFAVTNPSDLARFLENCGVPAKLALLPALALTMVPRIAKDAEETFDTLALRGEIKGIFLKWLPRTLAIFVASVLYRSEFLAQSLYFRGFNIQKRTHYRKLVLNKLDCLRLVCWLIIGVIFVYFLVYFKY